MMLIDQQYSNSLDFVSGPEIFESVPVPPQDTNPIAPGLGGPTREIIYLTGSLTSQENAEGQLNNPP